MPDWGPFLREFGLPISILAIFASAIFTGLLVAGKSVAAIEKLWSDRVEDWKSRYAEEHAARVAGDSRLETILPAIVSLTTLSASIKDELIRGNNRPPARSRSARPPARGRSAASHD